MVSFETDPDTTRGNTDGSRTAYTYSDILNSIKQCIMDADYSGFMELPTNVNQYLFTSTEACCQEHEYMCTVKPSSAPRREQKS